MRKKRKLEREGGRKSHIDSWNVEYTTLNIKIRLLSGQCSKGNYLGYC
jgi:hypothetical protein